MGTAHKHPCQDSTDGGMKRLQIGRRGTSWRGCEGVKTGVKYTRTWWLSTPGVQSMRLPTWAAKFNHCEGLL